MKHAQTHSDVTCPFCGLLCDDLVVESRDGAVSPKANACALARSRFAAADAAAGPARVSGQVSTLEHAVARAAALLRGSSQPVITGLATDVAGARAAVRLAMLTGAALGHENGRALERNMAVLQHRGWYAATLTEARNRADVVLLLGAGLLERFPRFAERVLEPALAYGAEGGRRCVGLGPVPPAIDGARHVPCALGDMGEVAAAVAASVRGTKLRAAAIGGVAAHAIARLAAELNDARYALVVWSAGEHDYPHADLSIAAFAELVDALNERGRAAVLPLGGSEGDVTAHQVCTWQSGWGLGVSFARGAPTYDPHVNDAARALADGEADCCVWVSSFRHDAQPPRTSAPVIALAHPGARMHVEPAVYIPVGVPGVDHLGHMNRTDGVVTLPLMKLRERASASAADVLTRLCAALDSDTHAHIGAESEASGPTGTC